MRKFTDEQDYYKTLAAMGLNIVESEEDPEIPPCVKPLKSNPYNPAMRANYGDSKKNGLTFEYNTVDKMVCAKGSRNMVMAQVVCLLGFFGRVKDVKGPPGIKDAASVPICNKGKGKAEKTEAGMINSTPLAIAIRTSLP